MVSEAVLITGCSAGIGRATALRLANSGRTVYATARRLDSIQDIAGCRLLALDVTSEESMKAAVDQVVAEQGAVGVLINNAGYSQSGAIETVSIEKARRQFETNFFGAVRLIQLVLPGMREQALGRIINISSMGGKLTYPGGGFYHASKFALEGLSDVLRFETAGFGIQTVVIEPGLIRTAFADTVTREIDLDEDTVYDAFNQAVDVMTQGAYRKGGGFAMLSRSPDRVAQVIEKAINARRPRARYRTDLPGTVLLVLRRLLGDRGWDRLLKRNYPQPGR